MLFSTEYIESKNSLESGLKIEYICSVQNFSVLTDKNEIQNFSMRFSRGAWVPRGARNLSIFNVRSNRFGSEWISNYWSNRKSLKWSLEREIIGFGSVVVIFYILVHDIFIVTMKLFTNKKCLKFVDQCRNVDFFQTVLFS